MKFLNAILFAILLLSIAGCDLAIDSSRKDYNPDDCEIIIPLNNERIQHGSILLVEANCDYMSNPDYGGSVHRVDFFLNDSLIYSTDTPTSYYPERIYQFAINTSEFQLGNYLLKVIATGEAGLQTTVTSAFELITVPAGMIFVEHGRYSIGSESVSSRPLHYADLNAFSIGKNEVSRAEWLSVMDSSATLTSQDYLLPVTSISWYDALIYCNKRSILEGLSPCYSLNGSTTPAAWGDVPEYSNTVWDNVILNSSAGGYRLPTEAEWESAACGGLHTKNKAYAGFDILDSCGWYANNSGNLLHQSNTLKSNELGIFDMSGNAAEWCWDWYGSYSSSTQTNPQGPDSGTTRIMRGGNYSDYTIYCLNKKRDSTEPYKRLTTAGLRVVRNY